MGIVDIADNLHLKYCVDLFVHNKNWRWLFFNLGLLSEIKIPLFLILRFVMLRDRNYSMKMQIRRRRRDVAIASRCVEASFSLTGEDEAEFIEGVETFKHLGRMLDRSYDDWLAVRWNVRKARQVWIQLGRILRRVGAEP